MTPLSNCSWESFAIILYAPLSLNENTGCWSSRLMKRLTPRRLESLGAWSSLVSMATSYTLDASTLVRYSIAPGPSASPTPSPRSGTPTRDPLTPCSDSGTARINGTGAAGARSAVRGAAASGDEAVVVAAAADADAATRDGGQQPARDVPPPRWDAAAKETVAEVAAAAMVVVSGE